MQKSENLEIFEQSRPVLLGLAYRILGSLADAEDAVQDTFVKWEGADCAKINNPQGWLTTVCTRRCLDMLKASHRSRVDYFGVWLPEPVHTQEAPDGEKNLELASSLTTAFLLLLERLKPKERAAFLLREVFDAPYADISATLQISEASCRQLISRAKRHIDGENVRHSTTPDHQERLLHSFKSAIETGNTQEFAALLADDVVLNADGGGRVTTVHYPLKGLEAVKSFIDKGLVRFWADVEWQLTDINGTRGAILIEDGQPVVTLSFACDDTGKITAIYIMRNPDKLTKLAPVSIH